MDLLSTRQGQDWLGAFEATDRDAAMALIANLELVSDAKFSIEMRRRLEELAKSCDGLAFFAARESAEIPIERRPPGVRNMQDPERVDASPDARLPYFEPTLSGDASPNAIGIGRDIGSEGKIAQFIGNLGYFGPIVDHPSIEQMRDQRVRKIYLVDDFIGSGNRILDFTKHIYEHRTLKSWLSRKWIEFHVLAYSGTQFGISRLQRSKYKFKVEILHGCPTLGNINLSPDERLSVISLCKRYSKIARRQDMALGFRKSGGLMVFEHGCPNNVPSILWAKQKKSWPALFPKGFISVDFAKVFAEGDDPFESRLRKIGEVSLSDAVSAGVLTNPEAQGLILLLAALLHRPMRRNSDSRSRDAELSVVTGLSINQCFKLRSKAESTNLIGPDGRLSELGRGELLRLRRIVAPPVPERIQPFYYPKSYRGS